MENDKRQIYVLIVAAGSGSRFGGEIPKQFCPFNGRPLLMTTISRFHRYLPHSKITVVIAAEMLPAWQEYCEHHGFDVPHDIAIGGTTRTQSVSRGIRRMENHTHSGFGENDIILIHDGARPNIDKGLVSRAVESIADNNHMAAVPVVAVTDSMRRKSPQGKMTAVDRSDFYFVQTPQAFNARKIASVYSDVNTPVASDDASLAEAAGITVGTFDGDYRNIKVTNPADLKVAEIYSSSIEPK